MAVPLVDPERILEVAGVFVVHLDPFGRVRDVNPAFERLTGYSADELRALDVLDALVPAQDRDRVDELVAMAKSSASGVVATQALRTRDAREVHVEWRAQGIREGDGLGLVAVGVDVTCRVRAEQALLERTAELARSESRLSDAQRVAKLGSWELDVASGNLIWSDEAFRIFEIDQSQFGASYEAFLNLVHPEDRFAVDGAFSDSLTHRTPYAISHRLRMPDGRVKWVNEAGETKYDPCGNPVRTIGTVQDVTSAVAADQTAAIKTAAMESSHNAIAFLDLVGRVTYVNAAFVRLWKASSKHDIVGHDSRTLWRYPDENAIEALVGEEGAWSGELEASNLDGTSRLLQASIHLVNDRAGRPSALMASFLDLTPRLEFERELEAQLREKEVLLREIHHRVKNNLQIISSMLHFESKRGTTRDPKQTFGDLQKRLLAMTLVHEKLYQSRNLSLVDFSEYVRSLVRAIATSFERGRDVRFEVASDPVALPIEIALPAGMILCELVTNVFKYAFPEGHRGDATVTVADLGRTVELSVSDDGVGLPPGFELASARSFGLELVRALTNQLDGEFDVEGGNGVRARVRFPVIVMRRTERPERFS